MTGPKDNRRRVAPHAMVLLALIPDEFVPAPALAVIVARGGIEVIDGRITGMRALRSAGAVTIRRHPDGHLLYARTPTGSGILADRARKIA